MDQQFTTDQQVSGVSLTNKMETPPAYDPKSAACLGCRIRRRKCNKEKPVCKSCLDLNVPAHLCVYRSIGLMSKDSKNTLKSIQNQNKELKQELALLQADASQKRKISETVDGMNGDSTSYKFPKIEPIVNSYKHFQLNPQKNPLDYDIKETNLSLINYGSLSSDALTNSEPSLKLLMSQLNAVIKRERLRYDPRRKRFGNVVDNDEALNDIKLKFLKKRLGLSTEDDYDILNTALLEVEKILPDHESMERMLKFYFEQNIHRYVIFVYLDEESVRSSFNNFLDMSGKKPKINIKLPQEDYKLPGLLLLLGILIFTAFIESVTVGSKLGKLNYMLYLEYSEIIFNTKPFQIDQKWPSLLLKIDTLTALVHIVSFELHTAHGRVKDYTADGAQNQLVAKKFTILGKLMNLHKDIDVIYKNENASVRKCLKGLWFFIQHLEHVGSYESGIPMRMNSKLIKLYPDYNNSLAVITVTINQVIEKFHELEMMEDIYSLVNLVEEKCIKVLKKKIRQQFGPAQDEVDLLHNLNYDDLSQLPRFRYLIQQMVLRLFSLAIIQSLHYVCFKKLEQSGDRSPKYERFKILTWKYSFLLPSLISDILGGIRKLSIHPNHAQFHVISSLLHLASELRIAQRAMGIYASARILDILKIENSVLIKTLLIYRSKNNKDREIHEILKAKGEYQHCYTISDFDDVEIDDDYEALTNKFSRFQDVKYIIVNFSRKMLEILDFLANNNYNLNYMKLNYGYFLMLKMSSLFLNLVFPYEELSNKVVKEEQSNPEEEFDFNELFKTAIDTSSQKFDFESFFTAGHGNLYQTNEIDEFFAANVGY